MGIVDPYSRGTDEGLVRPEGFEPPTLWSEARCSNPLSYGRMSSFSLLARTD